MNKDSRDQPWLEGERRPSDVSDETVEGVGKLGEAIEWIERARGRLYDFHQMSGHADLLLGEAADALDEAGHAEFADRLRSELIGRNVLAGRWTFQIVEEYDTTYWGFARDLHRDIERALLDGRQHVHESEMKNRRRTSGRYHGEAKGPPPD